MIIKSKKKRCGKVKQDLDDFADELKQRPTKGENLIRQYLEDGVSGCKFQFQVPIFRHIADFICEEHKLIIEVDGRQHRFGHQQKKDLEKDQTYKNYGYRVKRIKNKDIMANIDYVLEDIIEWIISARKKEMPKPEKVSREPKTFLFCKRCKKEKTPTLRCKCKSN